MTDDAVTVLADDPVPPKVEYALGELEDAFADRRVACERTTEDPARIVAGTPETSTAVAELVESGRLDLPDAAEALAVRHLDDATYVVGADDQGLMYALLELAETIRFQTADLDEVPETTEVPDTGERRMYTFLANEDCDAEWFYSKRYWRAYFDLLARSRFNAFQLVPIDHMVPVFRYFVGVEEHPEVAPDALTEAERERNLKMLQYITTLAEERGIDFVLGIWFANRWEDFLERDPDSLATLVEGLDWSNLASYTYHGLKNLLEACPSIRGVQLRVNWEAGIPLDHQTAFCDDSFFRAIEDVEQDVFVDLRGWMTHESTIAAAKERNIPLRLSMKYWAEFMGGPYQPAEHWPAYSYADFYKQPYDAPNFQQVWSMGSHRLFVWGDPTYVSTFADSLELGDNVGFEVAPQLAAKGFGNVGGAWRVLEEEYEHYEWEFERYWLFFRLFGRLTYDADAAEDVWMRHLRDRFGDRAGDVLGAYEAASKVMTFITRFNMNDPNLYNFPEADVGGVLDFYLDVQPSDPARIKSFREAAAEERTGEFTARLGPEGAAVYLRSVGEECQNYVKDLEASGAENAELRATLVDVESLGELALYHAEKTIAAAELARFYETGDLGALRRSVGQLERATPHWERLAEVAGGMYNDELVTGPLDNLTWAEKLPLVEEDVARLREQYRLHRRYGSFARGFDFGGTREFSRWDLRRYLNRTWEGERQWLHDFSVERGFTGVDEACERGPNQGLDELTPEYGWKDAGGVSTVTAPTVRLADKHLDERIRSDPEGWGDAGPYGEQLYVDYAYGTDPVTFVTRIDPGTYEVTVVLADRSEDPTDHGPLSVTVDGDEVAAGLVVPAGEVVDLRTVVDVDRDAVAVTFDAEDGGDWIATGLVIRPVEPSIAHAPVRRAEAGTDVALDASVTCPDAVEAVTLCLRREDGVVRRLAMDPVGDDPVYRATVPGNLLTAGRSVSYWFEATSAGGRVARLPERTAESPAFELHPIPADGSLSVRHDPVRRGRAGEPVEIEATVESDLPVEAVRLHYRDANQYDEYRVVPMTRVPAVEASGGDDVYRAEIPGDALSPEWDVIYYVEAVDQAGNGAFSPSPTPVENPTSGIAYDVLAVER